MTQPTASGTFALLFITLSACTPEGGGASSQTASARGTTSAPSSRSAKSAPPPSAKTADASPTMSGAPSGAPAGSASAATAGSAEPVIEGPATPEGYSLAGIKTLPEGCKTPRIVFSAAKKGAFGINQWPMADQAHQAHPQFKIVKEPPKAPMEIRLEGFELEASVAADSLILTGRCADADTCNRFAAAYHAVAPSANFNLACTDKVPGAVGKENVYHLSPKVMDDVPTQCARIGVCSHKADRKLKEDVHLGCQKAPSKYDLKCAMKETCDAVMACLKK